MQKPTPKFAYKGLVILTLFAFLSFSFFSSTGIAQSRSDIDDLEDTSNTLTIIAVSAAVVVVGIFIWSLAKNSSGDKKQEKKKEAKPDSTSFLHRPVLEAERDSRVEINLRSSQKAVDPLGQNISVGLSFKF